jgi:NAD+ kinase
MPDSEAFAVTPICPHALASRPLVVPDTARLTVRSLSRTSDEKLAVFADGALVREIGSGDSVEIVRAEVSVPLIQLRGYDPYEVLSRKLGWNGSCVK